MAALFGQDVPTDPQPQYQGIRPQHNREPARDLAGPLPATSARCFNEPKRKRQFTDAGWRHNY